MLGAEAVVVDMQQAPRRDGSHDARRRDPGSHVRPVVPGPTPGIQATLTARGRRIVLRHGFESPPSRDARPLQPHRVHTFAIAARGVDSRNPRTTAVADRPEAALGVRVPSPIAENALTVGRRRSGSVGLRTHAGTGSSSGMASGGEGAGLTGTGACAGRGSSTGSTTIGIDSPGSPTRE